MQLRHRMTTAVLLALTLALGLSGCKFDGAYDLPLPGNIVSDDESIPITADFTDALNVVPRTSVMLDDVPVGQVTDVVRKGWHARVKMRVRKDLGLPANLTLDVRQTSLLGEKYIALVRPESNPEGKLAAGAFIPISDTGRNPEVEEVLGALSIVLGSGGVGQIHTISVELNKALEGRQDNVRSAFEQLNVTVSTLNEQRDNIITAMQSVDSLSRELVKERGTIGDALNSMAPAVATLSKQHKAMVRMLSALDRLGVVGTRVINGTKEDLLAVLKHLGPTLAALADAKQDLASGLAMAASYPFPEKAQNIQKGDYANAEFFIDANLQEWIQDPTHAPNIVGDLCAIFPANPRPAECANGYAARGAYLQPQPSVSVALKNPALTPPGPFVRARSAGDRGLAALLGAAA